MPESAHTKVAVVVGVGPGLGAALARRFAAEYAVALLARTPEALASVAAEIEAHGGRALQVPTNVAAGAEIEAAFATIRRELGDPEVLLYNAAMRPFGRLMETKPSTFENTWRVATFGAFLCSQQVVPAMLAVRKGTIIFTGATAGIRPFATSAAFGPAKFAPNRRKGSLNLRARCDIRRHL
jgi:NAD(P)-dependent dehydrogenase (short-subunit alcohol dehydrogenase family)